MRPAQTARRRAGRPPGGASGRSSSAGLATALLIVFLGSCGAILFVLYQLLLAVAEQPVETQSVAQIAADARRIDSLAAFEGIGRLPAGQRFALTISEAEINQRIAAELAKHASSPFRDVTAKVLGGRVDFSGKLRAVGLDLNATVGMRFAAQSGRVGYEILSISFGPVPVPGVATQAVSDAIDRQLSEQSFTEQWFIEAIHSQPGAVTVVGRAK